jgi:hypothetical protein
LDHGVDLGEGEPFGNVLTSGENLFQAAAKLFDGL